MVKSSANKKSTHSTSTSTKKISGLSVKNTKILLAVVLGLAFLGTMIWVIYHYSSKGRHNHSGESKPKLIINFDNSIPEKFSVNNSAPQPIRGYYLKPSDIIGHDGNYNTSKKRYGLFDFIIWYIGKDPKSCIDDDTRVINGERYLALGGSDSGDWDPSQFEYINAKLNDIRSNWDGLCFVVARCNNTDKLSTLYTDCFAKCRAAGLKVIVTMSLDFNTYCRTSSSDLISALTNDPNITYISPQVLDRAGNDPYSQVVDLDYVKFPDTSNKILPSVREPGNWLLDPTALENKKISGYILNTLNIENPNTI